MINTQMISFIFCGKNLRREMILPRKSPIEPQEKSLKI